MSTAPELRAPRPAPTRGATLRRTHPGRVARWQALPRLLAVAAARLIDRCA